MLAGSITNSKLANSSITIDGNSVSLGGSVTIAGSDIIWTGAQTFRDNRFSLTDNTTTSKVLVFELSGIASATTRTLTIPDESGTIATQTYVSNSLTTLVAPGLIVYFATSIAPSGWLKCNGAAINRTSYANLFAAIGESWGIGDGASTFNIPDLRGEFVRVWDDSKGVDAGRTFGSSQTSSADGISTIESLTTTASTSITVPTDGTFSTYISTGSGTGRGIRFKRGGFDTRPRNVALLACIKI
jgi:microcystin-dependent protein